MPVLESLKGNFNYFLQNQEYLIAYLFRCNLKSSFHKTIVLCKVFQFSSEYFHNEYRKQKWSILMANIRIF